jgi:hypothetical protein
VVAGLDEGDPEIREPDPERRREVAEQSTGYPGGDAVHAEQGDGQEDECVEEDDRGQRRDEVGPGDQRDRKEDDRPPVPDEGRRQMSVREEIGARVMPQLVAARVVEPAVVLDRQREREGGEPLHADETAEHVCRAERADEVARAPEAVGGDVER